MEGKLGMAKSEDKETSTCLRTINLAAVRTVITCLLTLCRMKRLVP